LAADLMRLSKADLKLFGAFAGKCQCNRPHTVTCTKYLLPSSNLKLNRNEIIPRCCVINSKATIWRLPIPQQ
jgi:hypothetical protein